MSHSLQRPHLCASASDDGTVRLWGGSGMQACLAALRLAAGAPATGVHLSPFDGNLAAVACADHSAYVFDLRRTGQVLWQLAGHGRAVSYVRWLGPDRLVSASTDASLAVWHLPGPQQQAGQAAAPAQQAWQRSGEVLAAAGEAAARPPQQQELCGAVCEARGRPGGLRKRGPSLLRLLRCQVSTAGLPPICAAQLAWGRARLAAAAAPRWTPSRPQGSFAARCAGSPPLRGWAARRCWPAATSGGDLRVLELRQAPAPSTEG